MCEGSGMRSGQAGETSAIGQEADCLVGRNNQVVAKFDRFGLGTKRLSDFEVALEWSDVERLITEFAKAKNPAAIDFQVAMQVLTTLKASGWRAPEISN
jgi:hypothetical protein